MRTYDLQKLAEYCAYEDSGIDLMDDEFGRIVSSGLSMEDYSILGAIKTGERTSKGLAEILNMSEKAVRHHHYSKLTAAELLVTG